MRRAPRQWFAIPLVALFLILLQYTFSAPLRPSAEVSFADPLSGGVSVVPASCMSYPHFAGECGENWPIANFDGADCSGFNGWAFDPDSSSQSIAVHFYIDGPAGSGWFGGAVTADQYRGDVNAAYGIGGNHGFHMNVPNGAKNGAYHTVYPYAIDPTGNGLNPLINNAPKAISGCTFVCPTELDGAPGNGGNGYILYGSSGWRWNNRWNSKCFNNGSGNAYFVPTANQGDFNAFVNAVGGLGVSQIDEIH
jgi:hypothetical protein